MDRDQQRRAGKAYGIGMSVFVLIFGILWCVVVAATGAWFMLLFGFGFVGIAAYRLIMMLKLSREDKKEKEPWEQPQNRTYTAAQSIGTDAKHCPYCGEKVEGRFEFCPICGRRLP